MAWVAVAIGGGAVIGAYANSQAANSAASAQTNAANNSRDAQLQMYNQTRTDNEPWRQAGMASLTQLQNGNILQNFQGDPGYQFRLDEGNKAINAAASARGLSNSGATMKALSRYGQDYASNEYNNAYNRQYSRLSALAGVGQNATNQNQNAGMNYANQSSNSYGNVGNAQAANYMAQGNALNGAIQSGTNAYMQNQFMNRAFPQSNTMSGFSGINSTGSPYTTSSNIA